MDRLPLKDRVRFDANICSVEKDCIIWTGRRDRDGYGIFYFARLARRAHRVGYWATVGDITEGHVIDHICGNRACVNPQHLRVVTPKVNALADGNITARNAKKTHCPSGHPYDRLYGGQRYCSQCDREKKKRLRAKWKAEGILKI